MMQPILIPIINGNNIAVGTNNYKKSINKEEAENP